MKSDGRSLAKIVAILWLVGGCTVLKTDHPDRQFGASPSFSTPFQCNSTAGSYALPKTYLAGSITLAPSGGNTIQAPVFNGLSLTHHGDPDHRYCLSYEASPFAEETIRVEKTNEGILSLVTSNILDQSRFAVESIFQTIFVAATGSATASLRSDQAVPGSTAEIKRLGEFDPFDYEDTALFNEAASSFGYCVFIPDYSFDSTHRSIAQYCDAPRATVAKHPPKWKANVIAGKIPGWAGSSTAPTTARVDDPKMLAGILYRPRFPYTVYLMNKRGHEWVVQDRRTILLENISPIMSVGVNRAALSQKTTALQFRDGVFENVCIYNSAGVVELVNIPLSLAKAIFQLPAEIISVRFGDTEAENALLQVQTELLKAQLQLLQLQAAQDGAPQFTPGQPVTATVPALTTEQLAANPIRPLSSLVGEDGHPDFVNIADGTLADCPPLSPTADLGALPASQVPGLDPSDTSAMRRPHVAQN